jgi:hypothetical protein
MKIINLYRYNFATSNIKDARRSLFSILRDDDEHRLVLCDNAYKDQVESKTKFLQSRRREEKERLEEYLMYEEKSMAARKMWRDKEAKERGGWSYDILSRPNLVWIPGPDYYFV